MAKQTFTTGQVLTAAQMTSLQQTAMGGGSATAKTASYTLVAADAGTTVIMNSASSTTITVNTSLFAAGDTVLIVNQGAGVCTITAGTATVSTAGSLALSQYETGQLYFLSASAAIFSEYTQASGAAGALTLVHTETLSAVAAVNIDSKFTSTYVNYLVLANIEQSTAQTMTIQYRSAASTISTGYKSTYWYTEYTGNAWNVTSSTSATSIWSVSSNTDRNLMQFVIGDPQTTEFTKAQVLSTDNTYNLGYYSVYPQTTSIDGLRFSCSGTMTGTVRIYGYQNS